MAFCWHALDFCFEASVRDRIRRLERSVPPLDAMHAVFGGIIERSAAGEQRRGGLLVNSALEAAPDDGGLRSAVAAEMVLIEGFSRHCIAAGQVDGTVAAGQPPDALAKLLLSVLLGLRVLARPRPRPRREVLEGAVNGVPGLLDT